jgi:DHA1 family tetracycline resistance protein-like MFS transporter
MSFILIAVLIDMIAIGLIVPVLPYMVGQFTEGNDAQARWFAIVTFTFGAANFVASPLLGALSDRYGRRPVLLLGFSGLALSFLVTGLATAMWMLVVVRLFSGAMQANAAIANAYVADISTPEQRAQRMGQVGAMFGVGFILGPALGGVLGDVDVRLPFFVAGALAVANGLYGWFVLPESLPPERRRPLAWRSAHPLAAMQTLARNPGIGWLAAAIALATLAQFTMHSSWVLYTHFKFGWGPAEVGWSLFVVGLMSALVQGVLLRHLLKRFSPRRLAAWGLSVGALTYAAFGAVSEGWMMYVVIVVGTLLGGGAQASLQSIVSNAAAAERQGEVMGSLASVNSLMAVFAPVTAGPLLVLVSHRPAGDWLIGLPFFACAALQAAAAVIAFRFFSSRRRAAVMTA